MSESSTEQTILIVDDTPDNVTVLDGILCNQYRVRFALNGERALAIARSTPPPDLILLDVMMPGMDGYEVCRRLKADPLTRPIPVIFVTALNESVSEAFGLSLGAVDYLTKPINPDITLARVKTHLALYDLNRTLEEKVNQRTAELHETRLEIIRRLSMAAEFRDEETGQHVERIAHYSFLMAQAAGLSKEQCDLLFNTAPMHDIGKIGIPDRILKKRGKLTPQERQTMEKHTIIGAKIIGEHPSDLLTAARMIALTHHERWDGTGYPYGLKGEDIPIFGRIVMLADVFDALVSTRPYKKAWSFERALNWIRQEEGRYFDPGLIPHFFEVLPDILAVRERYA